MTWASRLTGLMKGGAVTKLRIGGAFVLMLALAGCDPNISQAKDAVRNLEKDPDSAEFRNVRECPTGFYVTGEVNGKNSYGAYEGYKTFYANSAGAHIVDDDEPADMTDDYVKMCNDEGYKDAELKRIDSAAGVLANINAEENDSADTH
jgi:hypothetical protein